MTIDLYYMLESPPCRTVLMVARHLNIELNLKSIDLSKGQQYDKDFVKLNPCKCVPTLVDNGFVLWESRAIATYLINQYHPSHSLYPTDPQIRATIDMFLQIDMGIIYKHISNFVKPIFFGGQIDETSESKLKEALNLFDSLVETKYFVCGKNLTLADISIISGLTLLESIDFDLKQWSNICQWISRVKLELKDYYQDINEEAIENTRQYIQFLKQKDNS